MYIQYLIETVSMCHMNLLSPLPNTVGTVHCPAKVMASRENSHWFLCDTASYSLCLMCSDLSSIRRTLSHQTNKTKKKNTKSRQWNSFSRLAIKSKRNLINIFMKSLCSCFSSLLLFFFSSLIFYSISLASPHRDLNFKKKKWIGDLVNITCFSSHKLSSFSNYPSLFLHIHVSFYTANL